MSATDRLFERIADLLITQWQRVLAMAPAAPIAGTIPGGITR